MLQVDIDPRADGTVVTPRGRLTMVSAKSFRETVTAEITRGAGDIVVVDLSQTEFVDSSGLGALVSISKRIREAGGELRLSGLNEDLRSLFELTKLDTLFAIADTPQQALGSF